MSLRGTETKRCAPNGADEERASPERNMWMPGRQWNAVVCLDALGAQTFILPVGSLYVRGGFYGRKSATELHVELASVIVFAYLTFSSGLPRGSVYYMNENLLQWAHSSLEPLSVTPSL